MFLASKCTGVNLSIHVFIICVSGVRHWCQISDITPNEAEETLQPRVYSSKGQDGDCVMMA